MALIFSLRWHPYSMAAHPVLCHLLSASFDAVLLFHLLGFAPVLHCQEVSTALCSCCKAQGHRQQGQVPVTERGLTQVFICSTLTSAQQGSVLLVWITLFMRISLLVINACALYKSGFKFLFETRLWKCCQMIFLPRQTVPFLWKMGMLWWLQKTLIWYKLSSYLQTQPLCSSKR